MNLKIFNTQDEKKEECKKELCCARGSCSNPASEDHTCPFAEEINGDFESLCNCCDDCTYECAMDI